MRRVWGVVAILLLASGGALFADATGSFYGTTTGAPTFNRPGSLAALSGVITRYAVQPFFPNANANCTIQAVQEGFDGFIFLYEGTFNPASPLTNLIALDDDDADTYGVGTSRIVDQDLLFVNNYYLVTAGYTALDHGTFTNHIFCDGPASRVVAGNGVLANYDGRAAELLGGRFEVNLQWQDFDLNVGDGTFVPLGSSDSGLIWFFQPQNWEVLIKVVDGCGYNGHFWVFMAATTNVRYQILVTDKPTGRTWTRQNPLGGTLQSVTDIVAFPCP